MASTRIKHRVGSGAALGATLPLVQQLGQMPRLTGMRSWGTWEGSGLGTLPTLGECPQGLGKQLSAAQLYATFATFDDRPHQLPGALTDLRGRSASVNIPGQIFA